MPLDLDRLEQRILGVLVEKEKTVPDTYPLTVNALVAGCNQKSNRDPFMSVESYEVEGALRSLMDRGLVVHVEKAGGRTPRYEHRLREQLAVDEAEVAILAELLNRGDQSPGELKTRAGRMHPFPSPAEVEARLADLAARPVPYVERLERRPREHAARWRHLLRKAGDAPSVGAEAAPEATVAVPPPAASPSAASPPTSDLAGRLAALEREVASLRERLERLESQVGVRPSS